MSAETIPAEVVKLARRVVLHCQNTPPEEATKIVERVIASAFTRPAEPAAPVAEAGDGEVVSWPHHLNEAMDALTSAFQWLKNIRYGISCAEEAVASTEKMIAHVYEAIDAEPPLVRLSTLEAERARADELRRLLTASGRCVDDLTARLDAFEHAQEKARDEGFNHALSILEDALGSPTYYAADGSETWEGDTRGTIYNLLRASGVWRGDDDMLVTKDRDFWKERFQVESRSRIEAEQRAADAFARAEKAERALETARGLAERGAHLARTVSQTRFRLEDGGRYSLSMFDANNMVALAYSATRASREAQPATDGGDNG